MKLIDADELNKRIDWDHITAGQVAYAIDTMPVANQWIDADSFKVTRRVVALNTRTNDPLLV